MRPRRGHVRVLDPADALRSALESTDEQGMPDHPRPEDPQRHFVPDRRLIGEVHLAELAGADHRPHLVPRHLPAGRRGTGGGNRSVGNAGNRAASPWPTSW